MLTTAALGAARGVAHGFFTREGGVSRGLYATLNCGPGSRDSRENVLENRRRAMRRLGLAGGALATAWQVHGTTVLEAGPMPPTPLTPLGKADGLVSRTPGLAVGVLTADCAPVLFADAAAGVVGAAHAGWRGALAGVLEATVAAMERCGAARARIATGIGPCIGFESYEVGPEFPGPFLAEDAESARFFAPAARDGRFRFDLAGYVCTRLERLGLAAVEATGGDTCAEPETLFSYRRARLAGEPDYGRALAAIAPAP